MNYELNVISILLRLCHELFSHFALYKITTKQWEGSNKKIGTRLVNQLTVIFILTGATFSYVKAEQTQEPTAVIRLKPDEMKVHHNCQNLGLLHTMLEEFKNASLFLR